MTLLTVGFGALVALVGVGQYTEDYCFTSLQCPGVTEAGCGGPGVTFVSPIRARCSYDGGWVVEAVDPLPLMFVGLVAAGTLTVVALTWWFARPEPTPHPA